MRERLRLCFCPIRASSPTRIQHTTTRSCHSPDTVSTLQHTIRLIRELDAEIEEIEAAIQSIMDELHSPITTIPGIGYRMGA